MIQAKYCTLEHAFFWSSGKIACARRAFFWDSEKIVHAWGVLFVVGWAHLSRNVK